jgi:hypothetical protein
MKIPSTRRHAPKLFAALAIATGVIFVIDGAGAAAPSAPATQPATTGNLLPPLVTAPAPSRKANVVAVPYRPVLPQAVVSHDPRLMPADASHPLHARPAVDLPPLASSSAPLPAEPQLPVGPPPRIPEADTSAIPVATIAAKPDLGRATLRSDPTSALAPSGALLLTAPPRTISPPAQLLIIPDPAHQPGHIPTPKPAEEDPPAPSLDRPGPTTLPVTGK